MTHEAEQDGSYEDEQRFIKDEERRSYHATDAQTGETLNRLPIPEEALDAALDAVEAADNPDDLYDANEALYSAAADLRGRPKADGYVGDGKTMPKTPAEALDLISGFIDGTGLTDREDERPDLDRAFTILTRLISEAK